MTYFQRPYVHNNTHLASTRHEQQGKMIVEGTGQLSVMPDQAVISIGVMTENKNVEVAQRENSVLANQVIESLKRIGILDNDIQTISYTIQPIYDFVEGKSIFKGYQIQHMFEITVRDLQKAGVVYESAVSAGANIAGSLRFEVSNKEIYYQQALQLAMKNAIDKAMKLGQQIGVTIQIIPKKITEQPVAISPRDVAITFAADASSQIAPPIQRRELEIIAKVSAVFLY